MAARLAEFYRRLALLPAAQSADEALQQICDTLEQVEDELSGIAQQSPPPPPDMPDGRLYPPRGDMVTHNDDGSIRAKTRKHFIFLKPDGTITVKRRSTGRTEFFKPGVSNG